MALGNHQKISRVIQGKPFGNGQDGVYSSLTVTKKSCSGTSTTLTLASSGFTNGDVVLIHQTRGTGVGQWEINRVLSGGGTTSLTMVTALEYTYTTSGASAAQVVKVPMYSTFTTSGNINAPHWTTVTEQSTPSGGIIAIACNGTATIGHNIGAIGGIINTDIFDETAFIGGKNSNAGYVQGKTAEGTVSRGQIQTTSRNGNGGGGGIGGEGTSNCGGGGGGHGANGNATGAGQGGLADGSADLTDMVFGGGGGAGGKNVAEGNYYAGNGAGGGGIIALFAKNIVVTGSINASGVDGDDSSSAGGGGGGGSAGGAILIACQVATLGSNLITSTGGSGGAGNSGTGGAGAVGRIALHYSNSYTGSTSPALSATFDKTLRSSAGMIQII